MAEDNSLLAAAAAASARVLDASAACSKAYTAYSQITEWETEDWDWGLGLGGWGLPPYALVAEDSSLLAAAAAASARFLDASAACKGQSREHDSIGTHIDYACSSASAPAMFLSLGSLRLWCLSCMTWEIKKKKTIGLTRCWRRRRRRDAWPLMQPVWRETGEVNNEISSVTSGLTRRIESGSFVKNWRLGLRTGTAYCWRRRRRRRPVSWTIGRPVNRGWVRKPGLIEKDACGECLSVLGQNLFKSYWRRRRRRRRAS